jgi:biofilm PGA synthesis N-glycosyltransferase PgaC
MMKIVFLLIEIIIFIYAFLLLIPAFVFAFTKQKRRKLFIPKTFISILVPVRNEEKEISACLKSLAALDYPKNLFEIIIIDDHSTDQTKSIAEKFLQTNNELKISVHDNNSIGKKSALTVGVHAAKAELIATTDGDCIVPKNWLQRFAEVYENENAVFIAGTVDYKNQSGIFRHLLEIEQIVLQIISGGAMLLKFPMMCSGANMAYTKQFFLQSGGYENDKFASGDDMMLMLKAQKMFPEKIRFLKSKDAIVKTSATQNFKEAVQQRGRWLSKFSAYKSFYISITGIIVFLMNTIALLSGIVFIFENQMLNGFILALGGKMFVDLLLLSLAVPFFREPRLLLLAPIAEIFYPLLAICSVMVRFSNSYSWKGRKWKT